AWIGIVGVGEPLEDGLGALTVQVQNGEAFAVGAGEGSRHQLQQAALAAARTPGDQAMAVLESGFPIERTHWVCSLVFSACMPRAMRASAARVSSESSGMAASSSSKSSRVKPVGAGGADGSGLACNASSLSTVLALSSAVSASRRAVSAFSMTV